MNGLEGICDANNLYAAFVEAKKGTDWKESVQRYSVEFLLNIYKTQQAIRSGKYKSKRMIEFKLHERGRTRCIKSQHISDRVVQRSLIDNVLLPRLKPKLAYDNGASLKGKGLDFSRRRFELHLRQAYKRYGGKGYVLLIDYSKYFDNIRHDVALAQFRPFLNDAEYAFVEKCFDEFAVDVSYMSDEEFENCMDVPFNALEYKYKGNGEPPTKLMRKSVGIGNQISQITGLYYPHRIDNFCKIVLGLPFVDRYMDDTGIILDDLERLKWVYEQIKIMCKDLGIFINEKKTAIYKLEDWLTYLKINYRILKNGRLIRKVHNSTIRRERRRLPKLLRLRNAGRLNQKECEQCYKSWRGSYAKYDSGKNLRRLDKLYRDLFEKGSGGDEQ